MSLRSISSRDSLDIMSPGNMRKFLGCVGAATLLLGVDLTANDVFQDVRHARRIASIIATAAKEKHFDGVFVHMEGPTLESSVSLHFLSAISQSPSLSSLTTLAITPRWMWRVANRLHELADQVEHIYLDMEELPTSEDTYAVTHIDPLLTSESVPLEDTISGCTDRMLNSGVPAEKIIIGLNSGGRSFKVQSPSSTVHGDVATYPGVRRSLQDVCQAPSFSLDNRAASAVTATRTNWTSVNFPKEQSLGKKIQWVTQEGLGGIGLSSLQMDDPKGRCGAGPYPSHMLIGKFTDAVEVNPDVHNLISRVSKWANEVDGMQPKTILSIGAQQSNDVWKMEVGNPIKKKNLINNIKTMVRGTNVSGVEISWTLEPLDGLTDPGLLSKFLTDLRAALPKSKTIFLSVNPISSFEGRYDVALIKKTVDLIVLQTHRLHTAQKRTTGHHSAMFAGQGVQDSRMTVESFVRDWASRGMPRGRMVVSVTAMPTTYNLIHERSDSSQQLLGLPTMTICQAIESNSTKPIWLDDVGVPVLLRGTEFIAYDNEKSAKIKATWSSHNNLGGMAIHGLPFDNPEGECPDRAFPILQSIVDTQVCSLCATESDSKCSPSFHTSCNYRLPEHEEEQSLAPANVPFEKCTEIVVEHAIIDANATIHFPSKQQKKTAKELKNYRSRTKRMILSMRCSMDNEEFAKLMLSAARRLKLAGSIRSFVDRLAFNGVELRCAHLVSKSTKLQFAHFLRLLNKEMKKNATGECGNTDLAIRNWEKSGLSRSKILLQVPSYGMEQLLKNSTDHGIGKPTEVEYAIIGQAELCQRLQYAGTTRETHWDSMSVNAYSTGGRWISIDDQQTVRYKMRYALREGLAGIGLMSLNEDDHMGTCGSGAFPILRSLIAKCH
ncbi:glycosyl hydrolase, family 18 [Oesophagostomum dentatum]|uniref:Glycosyl hydrolase, family 18 n=1 Tax=Oesophagostomum dentatum TaxID=61180 RepID=A0A0B1TIA8_OESDE|nr:glycosyl hydrolase, family 18 [Oesophagostomum dentatum]